jgi:parallel beta-helix repeat protein
MRTAFAWVAATMVIAVPGDANGGPTGDGAFRPTTRGPYPDATRSADPSSARPGVFHNVRYKSRSDAPDRPPQNGQALRARSSAPESGPRRVEPALSSPRTKVREETGSSDDVLYNVLDFGAACDGTTDDGAPIQAAVTAAQASSGTVLIPRFCGTSVPITFSDKPFRVIGNGFESSGVRALAPMSAVFRWDETGTYAHRQEWRDVAIDGNNLAQRGIFGKRIAHALFMRVNVKQTTSAGIELSYGWNNDIVESQISWNRGDGVFVSEAGGLGGNNAIRLLNTKLVSNRVGVRLSVTTSVQVSGCTIESNTETGIYLARLNHATVIRDNYFEANGAAGITFAIPRRTIRADVLLNGTDGSLEKLMNNNPAEGVLIEGNHTIGKFISHFVYAVAVRGLTIGENVATRSHKTILLGILNDRRYGAIAGVSVRGNIGFSKPLDPESALLYQLDLSETRVEESPCTNFLSESITEVARLNASGGGSLTRASAATRLHGSETWVSTGAADIDWYGWRIDLERFPELAGAAVTFSVWCRVDDAATGCDIWTTTAGSHAGIPQGSTEWRRLSLAFTMPKDGVENVGIRRMAGAPEHKAFFARPVFSVLGAPASTFYSTLSQRRPVWRGVAAPATGEWEIGDVVWNVAPSAGGKIGWVCVASGAPGDWKPFGTIAP